MTDDRTIAMNARAYVNAVREFARGGGEMPATSPRLEAMFATLSGAVGPFPAEEPRQDTGAGELGAAAINFVGRVQAAGGLAASNFSDAINIAWARLRAAVEEGGADTEPMKDPPAEEIEARASADHDARTAEPADTVCMERLPSRRRSQVDMTRLDDAMRDTHLRLMQILTDKGRGTFASRHELESVIREECAEVTHAVHVNKSLDQLRRELLDLGAVCVFGVACIEHGAMEW